MTTIYEDEVSFNIINTDIKLVPFYLPQFHTIQQNDSWWGKGFTEWTNTRKAKSWIKSHNQPREPHTDIGYYDLSKWNTLENQIKMAKRHGIYGFCFYHYWFKGQRLLEKPVDMFMEHSETNFPFCLCWANESWTRRWDGLSNDILIAQDYSEEDDIAFIDNLTRYIKDPRYIKIDNKPVILIYRPAAFPNTQETVKRWRLRLKENGVGEVYLICTFSNYHNQKTPLELGFDAAYEFAPNIYIPNSPYFNTKPYKKNGFNGFVSHYGQFVKDVLNWREELITKKDFDIFYSVMLEWDNTPRMGEKGKIFTNYSPQDYKKWLTETIKITRQQHKKNKQFIFINAWNEWAEGTYLEPDKKNGYLIINETSRILMES